MREVKRSRYTTLVRAESPVSDWLHVLDDEIACRRGRYDIPAVYIISTNHGCVSDIASRLHWTDSQLRLLITEHVVLDLATLQARGVPAQAAMVASSGRREAGDPLRLEHSSIPRNCRRSFGYLATWDLVEEDQPGSSGTICNFQGY